MEEKYEIVGEHDVIKKQKQERKDLQAKVQSLKKTVTKGDKKKKKDIAEEIANLEKELDEKHKQELEQYNKNNSDNAEPVESNTEHSFEENIENNIENCEVTQELPPIQPRISRAQKRRNKKDHEAKERENRILEQAEKNRDGPRVIEMNSIKHVLKDINLKIHNIPANGNCLYLAVNHQLQIAGQQTYSVSDLRKRTAEFMREHKDDFMPFMYNEMDETDIISEEVFEHYCKDVANTKLWGGQLEIKALSNIVSCPIKVIQATGPPTLQGENCRGPELILTYHRHLYRLGEHYNSTLPLSEEEQDS